MKNASGFIILLISLFSCKSGNETDNSSSTELQISINSYENHKGYDEKEFPLGLYTEQYYKEEADFAKVELEEISKIKLEDLSESEKISLELLKFVLQENIDLYEFEAFLNPLLSDTGFHTSLPYQVRDFSTHQQFVNYLNKLNAFPLFVEQHISLMRIGLEKGISQPKIIFNDFEDTYNIQIVDNYEDSFYYSPFKNLASNSSQEQKDSLLTAAKVVIETKVIPQFKVIKDFFDNEYFLETRERGGVSNQPNGAAYYQNRVNYYTTSTISAEEVHQTGLKEVARIKAEMEQIIKEVGFKGSFSEFLTFLRTDEQFYATTGDNLLKEARNITKKIDAQLPKFFKTLPRKPYGVAPVPEVIAPKYTGGRYNPPSDETQPGYYWVNTYNLKSRPLYILPSLTLHEAVPGHHLQISLNSELGDEIPKFRRNLYLSAYGEGWGLYSEFLGNDMGIYTTPYEKFGKYTYEMWRACRLVVDTGIHVKNWTREQAIEYLKSNTALSLHEVNTEIDRYISWPGQALSYKIGELKIREMREIAEKKLGTKFDIREFHEIILEEGTVTLSILEHRINNYIDKVKNE
ncbi:DUF885 domain-containing protein [Lutibacter flavus]|uniref:Uncharacterized conserved protein, DUF885 familyt n=1 Tax=Lutibacter flavus TaxID=691689 RepID=A0A238ZD20_9FLAO|nr:DUF885 domain-containing protein [Lutibacter flavus]SNR80663.1 Uncharacterized conserved protein, DUF885 familyt [Lutibacter flavus]